MGRARPAGTPALAPGLRAGKLSPWDGALARLGWGGGAQGRAGAVASNAKFPEYVLQGMPLSCCCNSSQIMAK